MFLVVLQKLNKYKEQFVIFLGITLLYLYRAGRYIFPTNYQQDDISEMGVIYVNNFSCAIGQGDNHPLFTTLIWFISKFANNSEYIVSFLIICIALVSFSAFFNILKVQFSIEIALVSISILLFSPSIITYSLSLKQYIFEFAASVYTLRFIQQYFIGKIQNNSIIRFCIYSSILVLFSFVNIIPFALSIIFIFLNEKKIKIQFVVIPILLMSPFFNYFVNKLIRVSSGGYWSKFFITNEANTVYDLFNNFYFLNGLFLKSLFVENLYPEIIILYLFSILISFLQKIRL